MSGNAMIEFDTRQGLELIKFATGLTVAGKLVNVSQKTVEVPVKGANPPKKERKTLTCYTIEERDGAGYDEATGKLYQFPAHADIKEKIRTSDIGKLVIVTCTGENQEFARNGQAMKTFDVKISRGPAPRIRTEAAEVPFDSVEGLQITDDDIPF